MAATLNRKTQRTARNAVCFFSMMHALFAVVLLVGDLFHPFNVFPVDGSRNGDMRHGGGGGGAVPMFDLWRPVHGLQQRLLKRVEKAIQAWRCMACFSPDDCV